LIQKKKERKRKKKTEMWGNVPSVFKRKGAGCVGDKKHGLLMRTHK